MSSHPQPLPLDRSALAIPHSEALAQVLADVKRLQQETEAKAAELDAALTRLRELTIEVAAPAAVPSPARRPRAVRLAPEASNDAILRATQMAVNGKDRDEIESVLSREFDVAEPAKIVDEILGTAKVDG